MYATLKNLKKYKFPVYPINSDNWHVQDGIVFVDNVPVDDLNKPGESIGIRRKQSGRKDFLKLKNPHYLVGDLLKSRSKAFISSDGKPFVYHKTYFQNIKYLKIDRFELRNTFTFVWIKGITIPFEIPRPPTDYQSVLWARVLYYGDFPWMIYEFSKLKGKDTRIKV